MSFIKCSQCKYLSKGEGKESFISSQGILTNVHHGRFYCEADISRHFSDDQIQELRKCENFRPRTLTLWKEIEQKIEVFLKNSFY